MDEREESDKLPEVSWRTADGGSFDSEPDAPSFDLADRFGFDGTLRTRDRVSREEVREEARLALAGAVEHLRNVLAYVEEYPDALDKGYPRELPSFDELVFALASVELR